MNTAEYQRMYEVEDAHWWYRALDELVAASIGKYVRGRSARMLDAGCGTGRLIASLGGTPNLEGIDQSPAAISFCRKRGLTSVRQANLETVELPDEAYDAIISLDALCHSATVDDAAVLLKFHRALKKGGILILNLPAFSFFRRRHDVRVSNVRRYRRKTLVKALKKLGYRPLQSSYRLSFLCLPALFKKYSNAVSAGSDLFKVISLVNDFLLTLARLENDWLLRGFSLPFGTSVWIVASKKRD